MIYMVAVTNTLKRACIFVQRRSLMPRKNKRKVNTIGKPAMFFADNVKNKGNPECVGCAFAGDGYVCTTSDGDCLKTIPERKESGNADRQR